MSAQLNQTGYVPSASSFDVPPAQLAQVPQSEVGSEMERLTSQCIALEKHINELESRIGPILSQRSGSEQAAQTGAPEPVLVPLAQGIRERGKHLYGLSEQLASIIKRIEL